VIQGGGEYGVAEERAAVQRHNRKVARRCRILSVSYAAITGAAGFALGSFEGVAEGGMRVADLVTMDYPNLPHYGLEATPLYIKLSAASLGLGSAAASIHYATFAGKVDQYTDTVKNGKNVPPNPRSRVLERIASLRPSNRSKG
jgi:hypothetical protein